MTTRIRKLGEVTDVRDGTHDSPKYQTYGFPLVTTRCIVGDSLDITQAKLISEEDYDAINVRSRVDQYDILISMIGTVGVVYQETSAKVRYAIKNVGLIKCHGDAVLSDWIFYWLKSDLGIQAISERLRGTTQKFISLTDLRHLPLGELPNNFTMQQRVSILKILDTKIKLNRQINKNLLKLSSNIVMAASLKSERITDLQTLLDSSRKANISIDEVSLDTYVSNTSLRANKRGLDTAEDYPSVKTVRAVEPGDVLVGNIRPYFKKIWFADRKGGASNDVITFRADNTTVTPEFLFGILYSDRFFDYVTATSKGTKMPRGDKQAIALYQVGLPDKDVITSVSDVVNPMLEQVSLNEKQNQQLTKLRNLLLPKLLAGDIDLSNIETVMNNNA